MSVRCKRVGIAGRGTFAVTLGPGPLLCRSALCVSLTLPAGLVSDGDGFQLLFTTLQPALPSPNQKHLFLSQRETKGKALLASARPFSTAFWTSFLRDCSSWPPKMTSLGPTTVLLNTCQFPEATCPMLSVRIAPVSCSSPLHFSSNCQPLCGILTSGTSASFPQLPILPPCCPQITFKKTSNKYLRNRLWVGVWWLLLCSATHLLTWCWVHSFNKHVGRTYCALGTKDVTIGKTAIAPVWLSVGGRRQ